MKAEDLFLAIGGVDSRRLAAAEAQQPSVIPIVRHLQKCSRNERNPLRHRTRRKIYISKSRFQVCFFMSYTALFQCEIRGQQIGNTISL